jgi:hypothetical protein
MNKENSQYLVTNFPTLYQDYGGDMKITCMAWGFECGDGWFELLKELSEKIESHEAVAAQVKEKFGGLRFYLRGGATDEVWSHVEAAEEKSYETCEVCGQPGSLRGKGWVQTLCDGCDETKKPRPEGSASISVLEMMLGAPMTEDELSEIEEE